MEANVEIDAGVCGFRTCARVLSADNQHVSFDITSDCEKVQDLAASISALAPLDAYEEISPATESRLLACCGEVLKGCCSGCAVPVGLFKAMQVSAGLALPKGIRIELSKT